MSKTKQFFSMSKVVLGEQEFIDVEVLRVGTIHDRGLKITKKMLTDFADNFTKDVYGTEIQVNLEHMRGSDAAGWVKKLFVKGNRLFAKVEWTELGREKISKNLFKFVSAEFSMEFPHHETGKMVKNVFIGLALTNTPALKGQSPLMLSEELSNLFNSINMFEKLMENLKKRKIVSKEDKKMLREALEELPADEQEEHEEGVAEVEAKPEEEKKPEEKPEEEKTEEEKKAEEEAAKKKEEEEEEGKKEKEDLEEKLEENSTKLTEANDKIAKLEETNTRNELKEVVKSELILSTSRKIGFNEKESEKVVDFMLKLDDKQCEAFKTLMSKVRSVDLTVNGSTDVDTAENEKLAEAEKEAQKRAKDSKRPYHECLAEVYAEQDIKED